MTTGSFLERLGFVVRVPEMGGQFGLKIMPLPCPGCDADLRLQIVYDMTGAIGESTMVPGIYDDPAELEAFARKLEADGYLVRHPIGPAGLNLDRTGVMHAGAPCAWFLEQLAHP